MQIDWSQYSNYDAPNGTLRYAHDSTTSPMCYVADGGALAWITDGFQKTFLKADRWKLMATGLGITLVITLASALFGTALGVGICAMRRSRRRCRGVGARHTRGAPEKVVWQ